MALLTRGAAHSHGSGVLRGPCPGSYTHEPALGERAGGRPPTAEPALYSGGAALGDDNRTGFTQFHCCSNFSTATRPHGWRPGVPWWSSAQDWFSLHGCTLLKACVSGDRRSAPSPPGLGEQWPLRWDEGDSGRSAPAACEGQRETSRVAFPLAGAPTPQVGQTRTV